MHQKDFENKQLGQPKEILIEEALHGRDGWYIGHTREYIKTAVQSEVPLENQIIHAVLKQISKDGYVEGEIVSAQGNC